MSNKSTLQNHNIQLQESNAKLTQAIDKANALPDVGSDSTPEMCTVTLVNEMGEDAFDPYLTGYWFKENLTAKELDYEALDYVNVVGHDFSFPEKVFTVHKNSVVMIEAQTMDKDEGVHRNNPLTVEGGAMAFSNGYFADAAEVNHFECRFYLIFGDCTMTVMPLE